MRTRPILFIAALGCSSGLIAQNANPLSSDLRQNYKEQKGVLLAEADRMPSPSIGDMMAGRETLGPVNVGRTVRQISTHRLLFRRCHCHRHGRSLNRRYAMRSPRQTEAGKEKQDRGPWRSAQVTQIDVFVICP